MPVANGINSGRPQGPGLVRLADISRRAGRETAISALGADDLVSLALASMVEVQAMEAQFVEKEAALADRYVDYPGKPASGGVDRSKR